MTSEELTKYYIEKNPGGIMSILMNNDYNFVIIPVDAKVKVRKNQVFLKLDVMGIHDDVLIDNEVKVLKNLDGKLIDAFLVSDDSEYSVILPLERDGTLIIDKKDVSHTLISNAFVMLLDKVNVSTEEDVERLIERATEIQNRG